jgi:Putative auto-transporter adhesin, head GIN domain
MKKNFVIAFITTILLSSCFGIGGKRVKGNGNTTTQERTPGSFTEIEQRGSYDIYLTQGSASTVKIEAEDNLIGYIETEVNGSKLKIRTQDGFNLKPTHGIKIYITSPAFNSISSAGSGNIYSQGVIKNSSKIECETTGSADMELSVDAPEIKTQVTGSGDIKINGSTGKFTVGITGSGDVKAAELKAEDAKVNITGSGNAEVFASVKLDVSVAGSGDVKYKGNAPQINTSMHGSGSLKKLD